MLMVVEEDETGNNCLLHVVGMLGSRRCDTLTIASLGPEQVNRSGSRWVGRLRENQNLPETEDMLGN